MYRWSKNKKLNWSQKRLNLQRDMKQTFHKFSPPTAPRLFALPISSTEQFLTPHTHIRAATGSFTAPHCGGTGSIPGHARFSVDKWHWDRSSPPRVSVFPCQYKPVNALYSVIHLSLHTLTVATSRNRLITQYKKSSNFLSHVRQV